MYVLLCIKGLFKILHTVLAITHVCTDYVIKLWFSSAISILYVMIFMYMYMFLSTVIEFLITVIWFWNHVCCSKCCHNWQVHKKHFTLCLHCTSNVFRFLKKYTDIINHLYFQLNVFLDIIVKIMYFGCLNNIGVYTESKQGPFHRELWLIAQGRVCTWNFWHVRVIVHSVVQTNIKWRFISWLFHNTTIKQYLLVVFRDNKKWTEKKVHGVEDSLHPISY